MERVAAILTEVWREQKKLVYWILQIESRRLSFKKVGRLPKYGGASQRYVLLLTGMDFNDSVGENLPLNETLIRWTEGTVNRLI